MPDTEHRRPASSNPLAQVLGPFTRTGGFYARSWGAYLDRQPDELPVARPTIALAAQAFRDEIVLAGFSLLRSAPDLTTLERIDREVLAAQDFYGNQGWLDNPEGFFAPPPPPADVTVRTIDNLGRTYQRLFFDSDYEPYADEPGRERWLSYTGNNREYGLMLRHREPRPWLVCIHGAEMGRAALDPMLFNAWHLHRDLGLNVVLPVLPMHGPRARDLPKGTGFPSEDVLNDVHGTAQAVWDIRRLLCWIRAQQPDAAIGLNGLSLGGLISSLVASLDDGLTCAILGIPAVDLVESGRPPRRPQRPPRPASDDDVGPTHRPDDLTAGPDPPRADAGPVHLRRHRRPAGAPPRAGHPALGALGQARDPLVPGRPHRVLPLAPDPAVHRRRAGAVRARRPGTDTPQTLTRLKQRWRGLTWATPGFPYGAFTSRRFARRSPPGPARGRARP